MLNHYVIQPKLDSIGDKHFLKRNLLSFKFKINYIRDRNNGKNLHEFEIKAYEALGRNLLRKAFTGIKIMAKCNALKDQENQMILEYQYRKWFGQWRCNYLIKS